MSLAPKLSRRTATPPAVFVQKLGATVTLSVKTSQASEPALEGGCFGPVAPQLPHRRPFRGRRAWEKNQGGGGVSAPREELEVGLDDPRPGVGARHEAGARPAEAIAKAPIVHEQLEVLGESARGGERETRL